jgi:hypothetical protein
LRRGSRQNRAVLARSIPAVAVVVLAMSLGCGRGGSARSGAPCEAGGARFLEIARAQLAAKPDVEAALRTDLEGLLTPMRDGMVRACRDGAWSPAARDCFAAARDEHAMKDCYRQLSPEQQEKLGRASTGVDGASL